MACPETPVELNIWELEPKRLHILTYPSLSLDTARQRLVELGMLGVDKLVFEGPTEIGGVRVIAKGTTGIVVKGVRNYREVAVKIRRADANRRSLLDEAAKLRLANTAGIGPRLLAASRNFLVWGFVEGIKLGEWIPQADVKDVLEVVRELLRQALVLDSLGLVHQELSRVGNHVLVTPGLQPVIFDFETASLSSSRSNLTQLVNALLVKESPISEKVQRAFNVERKHVLEMIREYKKTRNPNSLSALLG